MDYLVRFYGHLNKALKPASLPDVVYDDVFVRANDAASLVQMVNDKSKNYIFGMGVSLDPQKMLDTKKTDTTRVWIYASVLTHLTFVIKPLTGEIPMVAEDGKAYLDSGKDIVKN